MSTTHGLDHLQQVQELNRAFLELLQARVREQRPCFGLPVGARVAVKVAPAELIDGAARFPRALFRLAFAPGTARARPPPGAVADEAERDLVLSMLHAARHASRQSPFQARLLFGLGAEEIDRLCALALSELQKLAGTLGLLQCALHDRHWLWQGLFLDTRPELRRQLMLMALQPGFAGVWPPRRSPHQSQ